MKLFVVSFDIANADNCKVANFTSQLGLIKTQSLSLQSTIHLQVEPKCSSHAHVTLERRLNISSLALK